MMNKVLSTRALLATVAVGALLFGALVAWRARGGATATQWIVLVAIPWAVAAAALWLWRCRPEIRRNAVAAAVSTAVTLYLCEALLVAITSTPRLAPLLGVRVMWSPASRLETVRQMRASDPDVFPIIPAQALTSLRFESLGVQTLNPTVGRSTAVLCNERGPVVSYAADRYGFNNPDSLWDASSIDLVVIGDSYTHGVCVEPGDGYVDHLRGGWPATINLGFMGAGPLTELAILKEYAAGLRPDLVLWVHYEGNDLVDLGLERDDDVLPRYLAPGFSQRLSPMQADIDVLMRARLDSAVANPPAETAAQTSFASVLGGVIRLRKLRDMAGIRISLPSALPTIGILPQVMAEANRTVSEWGGTLVYVYLPAYVRFDTRLGEGQRGRDETLAAADSLGIEVIDLVPVFADLPDPRQLWAGPAAHLTPEGYEFMGRALAEALARRPGGAKSAEPSP